MLLYRLKRGIDFYVLTRPAPARSAKSHPKAEKAGTWLDILMNCEMPNASSNPIGADPVRGAILMTKSCRSQPAHQKAKLLNDKDKGN